LARSNIANPAGSPASMTKVDFDQAIADATAMPRHDDRPAFMTMVDLNVALASAIDAPRRANAPVIVTKLDFDHAFADTTAAQRPENTPPNREKLRNAGWQRILAPR